MLAKIEPEILCQTLKMAPGRVARGLAAKFASCGVGFLDHIFPLCSAKATLPDCVEYYDDPTKYEKGTLDENYYCEIWIPVKKKQ